MGLLLVVLFLVVPVTEIYVIVQVGQVIGALPTVALLLVESALGAWLVKREGRRAWRALRDAIGTARLPSRELADAALVLVGGTLLLTPGFVTDVLGFFLVLPPTRPAARRALGWVLARRAAAATRHLGGAANRRGSGAGGWTGARPGWPHDPAGRPRDGRVVPGEVVTDHEPGEDPPPSGPGRAVGG
jgi:UPF0716 protein FxsA